jgi:hypothetical protein
MFYPVAYHDIQWVLLEKSEPDETRLPDVAALSPESPHSDKEEFRLARRSVIYYPSQGLRPILPRLSCTL